MASKSYGLEYPDYRPNRPWRRRLRFLLACAVYLAFGVLIWIYGKRMMARYPRVGVLLAMIPALAWLGMSHILWPTHWRAAVAEWLRGLVRSRTAKQKMQSEL